MSSFERSVKGGTKVKLAPPKSKYVEHILIATQSGEAGVAEVFRTLTYRLRDSTWTVAFKALIIVHLMIKEGAQDVTLNYLSAAPKNRLAINHFSDVQTQGQNIRRYAEYLCAQAEAFSHAKCDYVRSGDSRMKRLSVDKGLLRETEIIQEQVKALLKCDFLSSDAENEISLTAFRLLTRDLLDLYNSENEAVMNVLSRYFEMSRPDAERAIRIYKKFCTETTEVVQYLSMARSYQHATRLEIPKIKHAPTGLAKSLQEYLDDKDFEVNRRQYLAEQEAKRTGKPVQKPSQPPAEAAKSTTTSLAAPQAKTSTTTTSTAIQPPKGPPPDLIDFFESIEQNQQTMGQPAPQFQAQPTGYPVQQQQPQQALDPQGSQMFANGYQVDGTNPFGQPMQQQPQQPQQFQATQTPFAGAGFGGHAAQPSQQYTTGNAFAAEPQQMYQSPVQTQSQPPFQVSQQTGAQQTNPFRQSSMPTGGAPLSFNPTADPTVPQRQGTNPFARSTGGSPAMNGSPFGQQPQAQAPFSAPATPQIMQPQATGTNPFARNANVAQQQTAAPPSALQPQPTGTNPFRAAAFVNQQTGQGWQHAQQPTMGGFENMDTIPVFPRPA